jgi:hypothetical protein
VRGQERDGTLGFLLAGVDEEFRYQPFEDFRLTGVEAAGYGGGADQKALHKCVAHR